MPRSMSVHWKITVLLLSAAGLATAALAKRIEALVIPAPYGMRSGWPQT